MKNKLFWIPLSIFICLSIYFNYAPRVNAAPNKFFIWSPRQNFEKLAPGIDYDSSEIVFVRNNDPLGRLKTGTIIGQIISDSRIVITKVVSLAAPATDPFGKNSSV